MEKDSLLHPSLVRRVRVVPRKTKLHFVIAWKKVSGHFAAHIIFQIIIEHIKKIPFSFARVDVKQNLTALICYEVLDPLPMLHCSRSYVVLMVTLNAC